MDAAKYYPLIDNEWAANNQAISRGASPAKQSPTVMAVEGGEAGATPAVDAAVSMAIDAAAGVTPAIAVEVITDNTSEATPSKVTPQIKSSTTANAYQVDDAGNAIIQTDDLSKDEGLVPEKDLHNPQLIKLKEKAMILDVEHTTQRTLLHFVAGNANILPSDVNLLS